MREPSLLLISVSLFSRAAVGSVILQLHDDIAFSVFCSRKSSRCCYICLRQRIEGAIVFALSSKPVEIAREGFAGSRFQLQLDQYHSIRKQRREVQMEGIR